MAEQYAIWLSKDQISYLATLLGYCLNPHPGSKHAGLDQAFPFQTTTGDRLVYEMIYNKVLDARREYIGG